jgi:hypothetical protein
VLCSSIQQRVRTAWHLLLLLLPLLLLLHGGIHIHGICTSMLLLLLLGCKRCHQLTPAQQVTQVELPGPPSHSKRHSAPTAAAAAGSCLHHRQQLHHALNQPPWQLRVQGCSNRCEVLWL